MSRSSPDSGMNGVSSADDGSMGSREGSTMPPEGATSRARELKTFLQTFGRSASPRILHARSPKKSIERTRKISGSPNLRDDRKEMELLEELRPSSGAYEFLHEAFSFAIWIHRPVSEI